MFDRLGRAVDNLFHLPDNLAFSAITIRKLGAMDRIDAMRVFARVVERGSFVRAAEDLRMPASTATDAVKQLEARLGVRLLQRTTRQVRPTLDGEAYYRRCLSILDDIEEAESAFRGAQPRGLLRVDVQGIQARRFIVPALPGFFAAYPDLELFLGDGDRFVDLVREGIDRVDLPADTGCRHVERNRAEACGRERSTREADGAAAGCRGYRATAVRGEAASESQRLFRRRQEIEIALDGVPRECGAGMRPAAAVG